MSVHPRRYSSGIAWASASDGSGMFFTSSTYAKFLTFIDVDAIIFSVDSEDRIVSVIR